jgi:hypothetical protein
MRGGQFTIQIDRIADKEILTASSLHVLARSLPDFKLVSSQPIFLSRAGTAHVNLVSDYAGKERPISDPPDSVAAAVSLRA